VPELLEKAGNVLGQHGLVFNDQQHGHGGVAQEVVARAGELDAGAARRRGSA
jgi:hypothetical protein